jgi:hypothetical protein
MRGFISVLLILAFVPFLYGGFSAYTDVNHGISNMKNGLLLHQRANEEMYSLENGFLLTIRDSAGIGAEEQVLAEVCATLDAWASKQDADLKVGFVDANTYRFNPLLTTSFDIAEDVSGLATQEWTEALGGIMATPCMNFLELGEGKIRVKDRALIDFSLLGYKPNFLPGYRSAFVFSGALHVAQLTVLIPEGVTVNARASLA